MSLYHMEKVAISVHCLYLLDSSYNVEKEEKQKVKANFRVLTETLHQAKMAKGNKERHTWTWREIEEMDTVVR